MSYGGGGFHNKPAPPKIKSAESLPFLRVHLLAAGENDDQEEGHPRCLQGSKAENGVPKKPSLVPGTKTPFGISELLRKIPKASDEAAAGSSRRNGKTQTPCFLSAGLHPQISLTNMLVPQEFGRGSLEVDSPGFQDVSPVTVAQG